LQLDGWEVWRRGEGWVEVGREFAWFFFVRHCG
jgi:hypothetical protein